MSFVWPRSTEHNWVIATTTCEENYFTVIGHKVLTLFGNCPRIASTPQNRTEEKTMARTIKTVTTDHANVSERTVTYELYVDGKFVQEFTCVLEALAALEED